MEFPDVLALPAERALAVLKAAGFECGVIVTEAPAGRQRCEEGGSVTEYVVRQRLLDNNKAEITLVRRFRKGGVKDGSENQ